MIKPDAIKEPEKVIRAHPFFSKVHNIQSIKDCKSKKELSKNLNHWVVMYGLLSVKNKHALQFKSSKKKPVFAFEMSLKNSKIKAKNKMGMGIVKFDKINAPPSEILFQHAFFHCKTKKQATNHLGEIVAISGKLRYRMLKLQPHAFVYLYNALDVLKAIKNKKTKMIARIHPYYSTLFFSPASLGMATSYTYGRVGYVSNVLWYDY